MMMITEVVLGLLASSIWFWIWDVYIAPWIVSVASLNRHRSKWIESVASFRWYSWLIIYLFYMLICYLLSIILFLILFNIWHYATYTPPVPWSPPPLPWNGGYGVPPAAGFHPAPPRNCKTLGADEDCRGEDPISLEEIKFPGSAMPEDMTPEEHNLWNNLEESNRDDYYKMSSGHCIKKVDYHRLPVDTAGMRKNPMTRETIKCPGQ